MPTLPNELLYSIIDYIAYTPKLSRAVDLGLRSKSLFEHPSPELLTLSVANWSLRRACLPFLFANLDIIHDDDVEKVDKYLVLFSRFTKVLIIDVFLRKSDQVIFHILPQLTQLFHVELRNCWDRTNLLRTIIAHSTVISVLVHELPDVSMCDDDLSKVVLNSIHIASAITPEFEMYLARGMALNHLEFLRLDLLVTQFESKIFSGLKGIRVFESSKPTSFSWLAILSSTHPTLNELWLNRRQWFAHEAYPFLSPLFEESQRRGFENFFAIKQVGLRRATGQASQEWYVTGLSLKTTPPSTSLIEILMLVASAFPKLEILTLNLELHVGMYEIGNLISALAHFSSLRVLYLDNVFKRLAFGSEDEKLMLPVQQAESTDSILRVRAESGLFLFVSCLAKQARALEHICIDDSGYEYDKSGDSTRLWTLQGWLHVLNGNRDVGGTLANTSQKYS
ncbi:hypothetical protein EV360DRAFT_86320 [Lentinula raphanica]|nr:hypothetical protein EV360DRAFT_86320 [Lentinula raphanica]